MTGSCSSLFSFKCFAKNKRCISKCSHLVLNCLWFVVCSGILAEAAPYKSKNKGRDVPQLVYDQKQTGDYNIQLHLKDFQIIALLGDDVLGDYDYNYDYADFTIKPSSPPSISTTPKPKPTPITSSTSTTTANIISNTNASLEPNTTSSSNRPFELLTASLTPQANRSTAIISNIHPYPLEIVVLDQTKKPLEAAAIKQKVNYTKEANEILSSSSTSEVLQTSPESLPNPSSPTPESMTPGKIKVQILEAPAHSVEVSSPPLGVIPGEDVQADTTTGILQGELASYRKCAAGFSRDKKGRCRRIRRPGISSQLPFGFGRIASNLATRLRLPSQVSPLESAILTEN